MPGRAAAQKPAGGCPNDEPGAGLRSAAGWDHTAEVSWQALEDLGGVVPEIEEDASHAPPAWWRYPSPRRSAALLAAEAREPRGLYTKVAGDLKQGDVLVRTDGAGACGRMTVVGERVGDNWLTVDVDDGALKTRIGHPLFFEKDGETLRAGVLAYRIAVKKDDTLGHVRELRRDLQHLERTIGERPALIAKGGRGAVDEKVHDLLDEAWSLQADESFDLDRRETAGRALALGAVLDWPAAAVAAASLLEQVIAGSKTPRPEARLARARLHLLEGEYAQAMAIAAEVAGAADVGPARYLLGRSLIGAGRAKEGLVEMGRYAKAQPGDPRARLLLASQGHEPRLEPAISARAAGALAFSAAGDLVTGTSATAGFTLAWPVSWRVTGVSSFETGGATIINLTTGRVVQDDGEAQRGSALVFVQRAATAAERTSTVQDAIADLLPKVKRRSRPAIVPGTKREAFTERTSAGAQQGEVTTFDKGATTMVLVVSAPPQAFAKLRGEFDAFVKSARFGP